MWVWWEKDKIAKLALRIHVAVRMSFVRIGMTVHAKAMCDDARLRGREIGVNPEPAIER